MKKTRKKNYNIIILIILIFFVISFITNILNSILVDVRKSFDLSLLMAGFLPFVFFIAYGIMSIPAGFLSEFISDKKLLIYSFSTIFFGAIIFSLFPKYLIFLSSLFIIGCSMAVLQVIINPMLRVAGGEKHFAFNSVLAQLAFGFASFISPYFYKVLSAKKNNEDNFIVSFFKSTSPDGVAWSSLYLLFSLIAFILIIIIMTIKFPKIEKKIDEKVGNISEYKSLIKNKWTILFFIGIFSYVGIEQGVGNWISQFLYTYHKLEPSTQGADTVGQFWAMLTIGCLLGLVLLKIMDSRNVLKLASFFAIISLIFALFGSKEMALISFPMVGFFIAVMWSIIISLALNSVSEHHGALAGIMCTGISGGAIWPLIVGGIADYSSLRTGMIFILIPLLYVFSIGFWAKPIINNR